MRYDPSILPPPATVRETKTFTHPTIPEASWTFSMRFQVGLATDLYIETQIDALIEAHGPQGIPLSGPEGVPIPVSRRLAASIAVLMLGEDPNANSGQTFETMREAMQQEITIEQPWSVLHWATLSQTAPSVFVEVANWALGLLGQARGSSKNASAAPAAK